MSQKCCVIIAIIIWLNESENMQFVSKLITDMKCHGERSWITMEELKTNNVNEDFPTESQIFISDIQKRIINEEKGKSNGKFPEAHNSLTER